MDESTKAILLIISIIALTMLGELVNKKMNHDMEMEKMRLNCKPAASASP